jgi:hypothetical protein
MDVALLASVLLFFQPPAAACFSQHTVGNTAKYCIYGGISRYAFFQDKI